jgi:hypothetical protein
MTAIELKKLGRLIARTLWSRAGVALLDKYRIDAWHAGGCVGLALALRESLGVGDLWAIVDSSRGYPDSVVLQHMLLRVGRYFFDGRLNNAARTRGEVVRYWSKEPGIGQVRLVQMDGDGADRREAASVVITEDTAVSKRMIDDTVKLLAGVWRAWR